MIAGSVIGLGWAIPERKWIWGEGGRCGLRTHFGWSIRERKRRA